MCVCCSGGEDLPDPMEARCQAWLGHQQGRLSVPELGHSHRCVALAQEEPGRERGGTSVDTEALTGLSELPVMAYRIGGGAEGRPTFLWRGAMASRSLWLD